MWKWNTRSCCSAAAKHASAISRVSASQVCGSGLPPSRKVVLIATILVLADLLQGVHRPLPVHGRNETHNPPQSRSSRATVSRTRSLSENGCSCTGIP